MKPSSFFHPAFTVPNYHQELSADRPIQVYTYDFRRALDSAQHDPSAVCGTVYHWGDVDHIPPQP